MAHVINSGWVDSLPRHLLRSPPLPGVASQPSSSPPPPQQTTARHTIHTTCSKGRTDWRAGGGCRVEENNGLSGEPPTQVNIHYKRPSSRLCIWAWRCRPCCYITRHLLPLFQARAHAQTLTRTHSLLFAWQGECVGGEGCQGEGCVYACICVSLCVCVNTTLHIHDIICCSLSFLIRMIYDTVWVSISGTFEVN